MVALYVTVKFVPQGMPAIDPGMTAIATEVTLNGTDLAVGVSVGFGVPVGVGIGVAVGGTVVMIGFGVGLAEAGLPVLWRME